MPGPGKNRTGLLPLLIAACAGVSGCATQEPAPGITPDPLEPVNRAVYGFNDAVDTVLLLCGEGAFAAETGGERLQEGNTGAGPTGRR